MSDYHKLRYNIAYVFLIISVLSVSCDLVPEFQFPCYVDVCTFPRQYCNSDRNERRCSPCTRSLCKQQELPRACLYFCQVADREYMNSDIGFVSPSFCLRDTVCVENQDQNI